MTEEIPERPPKRGPPTSSQVRTALYVLEWVRDETLIEHPHVNEAHRIVDQWDANREAFALDD